MINKTQFISLFLCTLFVFNQNSYSALYRTDPTLTSYDTRLEKYLSYFDKEHYSRAHCPKPNVERERVECLKDGLAVDYLDEKAGYININGETVIPHQYIFADGFYNGLASVSVPNKHTSLGESFGYIDTSGNMVIEPIYRLGHRYSEGLVAVLNKDNKYGFIDKNGRTILPFIYDYPEILSSSDLFENLSLAGRSYTFYDGIALVLLNNEWTFIDKQGNIVEYLKN